MADQAKIKGQSDKLYFRAAMDNISKNGDVYKHPDCDITIKGASIRPYGKVQELIAPVKLSRGKAQLKIKYSF